MIWLEIRNVNLLYNMQPIICKCYYNFSIWKTVFFSRADNFMALSRFRKTRVYLLAWTASIPVIRPVYVVQTFTSLNFEMGLT